MLWIADVVTLQWGVGRRFAMEKIYHGFRFAKANNQQRYMIFLDKRNAFNQALREKIFQEVSEAKLEMIIPFLRLLYGTKSSSWVYDASVHDLREDKAIL